MKKIIMICVVAVTVAVISFAGLEVAQGAGEKEKADINTKVNWRYPRVKWEYMIYPSDGRLSFLIEQGNNTSTNEDFVKAMNKLGAEGWEIIQIGTFVVLKRIVPRPEYE